MDFGGQSAEAVFLAILGVVPDCVDALANLGVAYVQRFALSPCQSGYLK